jgi:hypothetical protein
MSFETEFASAHFEDVLPCTEEVIVKRPHFGEVKHAADIVKQQPPHIADVMKAIEILLTGADTTAAERAISTIAAAHVTAAERMGAMAVSTLVNGATFISLLWIPTLLVVALIKRN